MNMMTCWYTRFLVGMGVLGALCLSYTTVNADGGVGIYFGPEKPERADNWRRTVPGKSWFTIVRLYGPDKPQFDNTWKPNDIVEVK